MTSDTGAIDRAAEAVRAIRDEYAASRDLLEASGISKTATLICTRMVAAAERCLAAVEAQR